MKCVAAGKCVLRNPREPWKWGKSRGGGGGGLSTFFDFNAGPLHSVPVVESKTGLACVSRSQHCLHNRYISRCNVPNRDVLYACYLLGIAGALSRRGEGREERKERKKEERKRRGQGGKREEEGKKKKKWVVKVITRRDLGNLLTPRFLRPREGIIKVKEKLKVREARFRFYSHVF